MNNRVSFGSHDHVTEESFHVVFGLDLEPEPSEHDVPFERHPADLPWLEILKSGIVNDVCKHQATILREFKEDFFSGMQMQSVGTDPACCGLGLDATSRQSTAGSGSGTMPPRSTTSGRTVIRGINGFGCESEFGSVATMVHVQPKLDAHFENERLQEKQQKEWYEFVKEFVLSTGDADEHNSLWQWCLNCVKIPARLRETPDNKIARVVIGHWFGTFITLTVLLNVVFIGYETSAALEAANNGRFGLKPDAVPNSQPGVHDPDGWFIVFHRGFAFFFLCELIVKIAGLRWSFFVGRGSGMNMLDVLMVASTSLEFAFEIDVRHARLLRAFRMARVLRVVRILAAFRQLREIVCSLYNSMAALAWSFAMMFTIMFCFSLVFMQSITAYIRDADALSNSGHGAYADELARAFGTLHFSISTLFEAIAGGIDWYTIAVALEDVNGFLVYVFHFYIFIMVFGVLNVLIGVFCEQANQSGALDPDLVIHAQKQSMKKFLQVMRNIFIEIDRDCDGEITWEEFRTYLQNPKAMNYLMGMGFDLLDARQLFRMIDGVDELGAGNINSRINMQSFCSSMLRLSGDAKSTDLILVLHETRRQTKLLNHILGDGKDGASTTANLLGGPSTTNDVEKAKVLEKLSKD